MSAPASAGLVLSFLATCCAKATLLLGFAWILTIAGRQRSAALRHHLWAAASATSLALPFCALFLPAWHSARLQGATALWNAAHGSAASSGSYSIPSVFVDAVAASPVFNKLAIAALIIWAFGSLLVLGRLVAGLARIAWVSAHAKAIFEENYLRTVLELSRSHKLARSVRLLQCETTVAMPLTWGVFRPVILLPAGAEQWSEERRLIVLSHELAHIARHDWLLQICAELARAFYWFHPLVWLAVTRVRQESELACDDAVLHSGVAPSDYASQLLDLARTFENSGRAWSTALAIARPSNLERRFAAMLSPSINRHALSGRSKFLVPILALAFVLPLATLRLPAQGRAGKTSGTIHDPSGARVANATIVMSNHDANTIDMTTTDRDGNFSFNSLPAGKYELQVYKPGFEVYTQQNVSLDPGRDFSEVFTLFVGADHETVKVVPEGSEKPVMTEETNGKPLRLAIGGTIEAAKLIKRVQPTYPRSAKSAGISGTVVLHAVIGMDGKPLSLRVMNSQIDPDLARSAVEAVSQWRYTPTLLNGEPIEVDTTIMVNFTLAP
jgi:TonB family protein